MLLRIASLLATVSCNSNPHINDEEHIMKKLLKFTRNALNSAIDNFLDTEVKESNRDSLLEPELSNTYGSAEYNTGMNVQINEVKPKNTKLQ